MSSFFHATLPFFHIVRARCCVWDLEIVKVVSKRSSFGSDSFTSPLPQELLKIYVSCRRGGGGGSNGGVHQFLRRRGNGTRR
jgi:hypothetical protein